MRRLFASLLAAALWLALPPLAAGQQPARAPRKPPDPMTFRLVTSDPDAPADGQTRWVAASGAITPETPAAFAVFLKSNDISGLTIYFHSTGGSIGGAIRLGEALRQARARVSIGRSAPAGEAGDAEGSAGPARLARHQLAPAKGECFSACAYAFLGGTTRSMPIGAAYGVHMFWPGDKIDGLFQRTYDYREIERAQRVSADIAAYFQRVGANMRVLELASRTPPKGPIRRLTLREIVEMNVASLEVGGPLPGGAGRWGVLVTGNSALLMSSGEAAGVRYGLEIGCGAAPGFRTAVFEATPASAAPLAIRRVVLTAGAADGVIATQGKDGLALPARFNRVVSEKPGAWLRIAGALPSQVMESAVASGLEVRLEDGDAARRTLSLPAGNLPRAYPDFLRACASAAERAEADRFKY